MDINTNQIPKMVSDKVLFFLVNNKTDKNRERKIPIVKIVFITQLFDNAKLWKTM